MLLVLPSRLLLARDSEGVSFGSGNAGRREETFTERGLSDTVFGFGMAAEGGRKIGLCGVLSASLIATAGFGLRAPKSGFCSFMAERELSLLALL
jgi:hypothetical protein